MYFEQIEVAKDGVHGRTDLVADSGEELLFGAGGMLSGGDREEAGAALTGGVEEGGGGQGKEESREDGKIGRRGRNVKALRYAPLDAGILRSHLGKDTAAGHHPNLLPKGLG